jgi:predicted metal-dependent HD superfamily phosphohydrolase
VSPAVYDELIACYSEPHRAYHTLQHLEECFALFDEPLAEHADEALLALWFHDAIYQPKRYDNEEKSADWGADVLAAARAPAEVIARFRDLVLATRHEAQPQSPDARLLVDIDLSILGAEPERFDEYERQVRKEYAHVPDLFFRMGRAKILKQFLARPAIYSTAAFRERFEARARANVERSLARSTKGITF